MNKNTNILQRLGSMSKKKKIIILVVTLLIVALTVSAICLYSWYRSSALSAAVRIGVAIAERDAEEVFDSIESADADVLRLFMRMLFLTEERALDLIYPEGSDGDLKRVSLLEYSEQSNTADVRIRIVYKDGNEQELTLRFVREDGEWKLSINELITDLIGIK